MKATTTIVAMALTALAVAPQRGFAQYGPAPPAAYPGGMAGLGAYPAPGYYPPMGATSYLGHPAMGQPPGTALHPTAMARQEPPPAPPWNGGEAATPPGAYPPPGAFYGPAAGADPAYGVQPGYGPGLDLGYGAYAGGPAPGEVGCESCLDGSSLHHGGLAPVFFGAEWLLWVRHGQQVPPLVTTSPAGAAPGNAGVIGQGGIVVFGGTRMEDGFVPGGRFTTGVWLDPLHEIAVGARAFILGTDETNFDASSPQGQPIIARPFIDLSQPGAPEAAFVVAFDDGDPNTAPRTGALHAEVTNDLWGGDVFSSVMLARGVGYRIDLQAGYQYYRIDESVLVRSTSVQGEDFFGDNIPNQTVLTLEDLFDTENEFHGGAVGMLTELQQGAFSLKLLGRVAVGNMNERVRIAGQTTVIDVAGNVVTLPGGVLATAANSGQGERDRTVVSPEVGITLGYNFTQNLTLTTGYSFIYWTHVAQAGPQINRAVDPTAPAPAQPVVPVRDTDFWVMGLNGGLEWRY